DVIRREAELLHEARSRRRSSEAVDADRTSVVTDPFLPTQRDPRLYGQAARDRSGKHGLAVVCRLLLEQLPAGHGYETRLDPLVARRPGRGDGEWDFGAGRQQQTVGLVHAGIHHLAAAAEPFGGRVPLAIECGKVLARERQYRRAVAVLDRHPPRICSL